MIEQKSASTAAIEDPVAKELVVQQPVAQEIVVQQVVLKIRIFWIGNWRIRNGE